jgi:hypothetical protein
MNNYIAEKIIYHIYIMSIEDKMKEVEEEISILEEELIALKTEDLRKFKSIHYWYHNVIKPNIFD